ncbi:hypothetical protein AB28_5018 [Raoultella ornithinolytica 2-156-04_S1_C2]|nr:hypothetical protein AB00_4797 [Raoultella ornithinolytica 2-156-04_S1_C1]KDX09918.1 hypothetical protein AB28_5018 [Raoultella ornithinolytica 2-156-04_S1_C2]
MKCRANKFLYSFHLYGWDIFLQHFTLLNFLDKVGLIKKQRNL